MSGCPSADVLPDQRCPGRPEPTEQGAVPERHLSPTGLSGRQVRPTFDAGPITGGGSGAVGRSASFLPFAQRPGCLGGRAMSVGDSNRVAERLELARDPPAPRTHRLRERGRSTSASIRSPGARGPGPLYRCGRHGGARHGESWGRGPPIRALAAGRPSAPTRHFHVLPRLLEECPGPPAGQPCRLSGRLWPAFPKTWCHWGRLFQKGRHHFGWGQLQRTQLYGPG